MKKSVICAVALFFLLAATIFAKSLQAKSSPPVAHDQLKDAVVLIVRHAEKPQSGRLLSSEGQKRAEAYVKYFQTYTADGKQLKLDHLYSASDSKNSQRPRLTLEPLSKAIGLPINCQYNDNAPKKMVAEIQGKQILISWRHGEIPALLRAFGANPRTLLPGGTWPDSQFGWVVELRYDKDGKLLGSRCVNQALP